MQQEAIIFFHNITDSRDTSIDKQINQYLKENPNKRVSSVAYAVGGMFEKAIVIFDSKPQEHPVPKKENNGNKR